LAWFWTVEVQELFRRTLDTARKELGVLEAASEWRAGRAMEPTEAAALAASPSQEQRPSMPLAAEQTATLGVLSRRESEVAILVSQGMTSRQIAERLHLAARTVENHVQNSLNKLDLNSRAELAAWTARRTEDSSRKV
jgi:non-specific serine/threonine protein kinase